ncbi:hypothetical protein SHIRM173S_11565 [Streptomyces hirsutus]
MSGFVGFGGRGRLPGASRRNDGPSPPSAVAWPPGCGGPDLRTDLVRGQPPDRQRRTAAQHVVRRLGPLVVPGPDDLRPDLRRVRVDAPGQRGVSLASRAMSKASEP